jgi:hypothetical protein
MRSVNCSIRATNRSTFSNTDGRRGTTARKPVMCDFPPRIRAPRWRDPTGRVRCCNAALHEIDPTRRCRDETLSRRSIQRDRSRAPIRLSVSRVRGTNCHGTRMRDRARMLAVRRDRRQSIGRSRAARQSMTPTGVGVHQSSAGASSVASGTASARNVARYRWKSRASPASLRPKRSRV